MLAFLSVGSRRVEYVACSGKPHTAWMLQQARNLLMDLDDRGRQVLFLIHDRDAKFPRAFDAVLDGEKIKVIRTPIQAPNANAHMERWVGSVRRECLDRLLMFGRRQLPPDSSAHSRLGAQTTPRALQVSRRDLLRGLIHEYERAAA